jgi:hypothetical protein
VFAFHSETLSDESVGLIQTRKLARAATSRSVDLRSASAGSDRGDRTGSAGFNRGNWFCRRTAALQLRAEEAGGELF